MYLAINMTGTTKYPMSIPEQLKIHFCIVSHYCNFIFLTESPWGNIMIKKRNKAWEMIEKLLHWIPKSKIQNYLKAKKAKTRGNKLNSMKVL